MSSKLSVVSWHPNRQKNQLMRLSCSTGESIQWIPPSFICSMTHQVMENPVIADDGCTYDNEAISEWLKSTKRSPTTNAEMRWRLLVSNKALRQTIGEWRSQSIVRKISDIDDFELDANDLSNLIYPSDWTLAVTGLDKKYLVSLDLLSRRSDFFFRVRVEENETDWEISLHPPAIAPDREVQTRSRALNMQAADILLTWHRSKERNRRL